MKILIVDDSINWVEYHIHNLRKFLPQETVYDTATSARQGLDKLTSAIDEPYDVIFTDMQMESDFLPLFAGEWFIKQIKTFKEYEDKKIIAVSAAGNLKQIAAKYDVSYIPKLKCSEIKSYKEKFV